MSRSDDCTCDSKSTCSSCRARATAGSTDQPYYPFDYTLDGPPTIEWW